MKKIIFLDRDGTIIEEPLITKQVNSLEEMVFLP
jgi:imidazoleglycerol-phosphate dehydratase / histidinol-phosphatase